jgi:hypothetical protein
MDREPQWLLDHASNAFSQWGEDGVIARILATLPERDRWCVEFGAGDGVALSNTRRLIAQDGCSAVMIEGDAGKYRALERNCADRDNVRTIRAFVGFSAEDGLDALLSDCGVPENFDFLSIDIDGNDYHVWQAIEKYRPKAVCVEFNPTVPPGVRFVQPADPGVNQGCSLLALDELARSKGYELVSVLFCNALFVDGGYFADFGISDNRPEVLQTDLSAVTWLFTGYDGTVHLAGSREMPWHGLRLDERRMQLLPRVLRHFPDRYSLWQKKLLGLLRRLRNLRLV